MANNNFGYYIHGKSAHGFSDTDMATLLEQLQACFLFNTKLKDPDWFENSEELQAISDLLQNQ